MGQDGVHRIASNERELWELPVHWSLDDAPHFAAGGEPDALWRIWSAELAAARADRRHLTYTLHPEILGRPSRLPLLERLLEESLAAGAWIAPHRDVVAHVASL